MGTPDPNGRQLDGMGGGVSSLSKVCVIAPPTHPEADVDYTFAQIGVEDATVDYGGNCGNMSSAVGPFAVDEGLLNTLGDGATTVRIHNTNTRKLIVARFAIEGGRAAVRGPLAIDGVSGTGAPIRLEFRDLAGARTGTLLPTGKPVDSLSLPGGRVVHASLVDAANPCVFIDAAHLGLIGNELPQDIATNKALMADLEALRRQASIRMGLAPDLDAAAASRSVPFIGLVAPPRSWRTQSGIDRSATEADIAVRMLSSGHPHRAIPITSALCVAVACRTPATLPGLLCSSSDRSAENRPCLRHGHRRGRAGPSRGPCAARERIPNRPPSLPGRGDVFRTRRRLLVTKRDPSESGDVPHYRLHIGGEWREGRRSRRFDSANPYTARTWATVAQAEPEDVAAAIAAARDSFDRTWSRVNGYERGRLMLKLADLLHNDAARMGRLESTDNGKIIRETQTQMVFAARHYRFFAGYADKLWGRQIPLDQRDAFDYATREPLGVVALITAWNSPMGLLANKLAPALAAGNCVVIKPSEHASVTTLEFCKLVEAAGFPPGVINVVCGPAEVGQALVGGGVAKVSFTGSSAVGREIAAAAGRNLIPVTLELGGKSANIVFADANLTRAADGVLAGIFGASGQTCIAGSRLLVERPIHDSLVQTLADRARSVRLGDPLDLATDMGTAANEPHFRRILGFIERAKTDGARVVAGGGIARGPGLDNGFFIEPTVFVDVRSTMEICARGGVWSGARRDPLR